MRLKGLFFLLPVALSACTPAELAFEEIPSPAAAKSAMAHLAVSPDGRVFASWLEAGAEKAHALRFAWLGEEARTMAEGDDRFVNWAHFPIVVALTKRRLAAHFLAKSGEGTYAYDAWRTQSADDGHSWSDPARLHRDTTTTEHGFVSLLALAEDRLFAAWLDGRNHPESGEMTLRSAVLDPSGTFVRESVLDRRVCDCCQTAAAIAGGGPLVAYRDRTEGEIRDISVVRPRSAPEALHADGWEIPGCPVNGPAMDASGSRAAAAWFTAADDDPRVLLSVSDSGGRTFSAHMRVSEGRTAGCGDTAVLASGDVLVTGMEDSALRIARFSDGRRHTWVVAPIDPGRQSGFPWLAATRDAVYIAWTDAARMRIARAAL